MITSTPPVDSRSGSSIAAADAQRDDPVNLLARLRDRPSPRAFDRQVFGAAYREDSVDDRRRLYTRVSYDFSDQLL
jgi:hypothetical protein